MSDLRTILKKLLKGEIGVDDAEKLIKLLAVEELGNVVFDVSRELRRGIPEVVLGEGKDLNTLLRVVNELAPKYGRVIISRIPKDFIKEFSMGLDISKYVVNVYGDSRLVIVRSKDYVSDVLKCRVAVVTAGTADVPVAEEVEVILKEFGCELLKVYDVGVAGLQRVINAVKKIKEFDADVAVVIAGREGALPSVISSLLDIPVVAVPTSHGYGFGAGVSALTSMLQSCSLGIAVVNVDNGVGAALFTALMCRRISSLREGCG